MIVIESKEYNVVLENEYLDKVKATIDFSLGLMSIGANDKIEYIPITCWNKIENPNQLYPIPYKQIINNDFQLELEEDDDNDDSN